MDLYWETDYDGYYGSYATFVCSNIHLNWNEVILNSGSELSIVGPHLLRDLRSCEAKFRTLSGVKEITHTLRASSTAMPLKMHP